MNLKFMIIATELLLAISQFDHKEIFGVPYVYFKLRMNKRQVIPKKNASVYLNIRNYKLIILTGLNE